jgi:Cellulose biosynthesis protein BcsN
MAGFRFSPLAKSPLTKSWTVRTAMLLGLLSSTVGCTRWYDPDSMVPTTQAWQRISPEDAPVVFARDASAVILAARRQAFGKLTETYEITLENPTVLPGENGIRMEVRHRPTSMLASLTTLSEPFATPRYDERMMNARLREEFPTLKTRIETDLRQNRYGLYSYATATDGYVSCVLAWQVIDDYNRVLPPGFALLRTEYRFCAPDAKPARLLAMFDKATLFFGGHMMPETEAGSAELGSMEVKPVVATVGRPMALTPNVERAPGLEPDNDRSLDFNKPAHARTMQRLLKDMGLYDGQIDGIWGPKSRQALKAFKETSS